MLFFLNQLFRIYSENYSSILIDYNLVKNVNINSFNHIIKRQTNRIFKIKHFILILNKIYLIGVGEYTVNNT